MLPKNKIRAIYFCTSCVMFLPKNVHFFCFLGGDCPPHPHPHHAPQPVRLCLAACSLTHNSNEVFTHSTPTPSPSPPQKNSPENLNQGNQKSKGLIRIYILAKKGLILLYWCLVYLQSFPKCLRQNFFFM